MTRRVQYLQRPAVPLQHIAVGQGMIWAKPVIHTFTTAHQSRLGQPLHHRRTARRSVAKSPDLGPGPRGQRTGEGGVIQMRMGHDDMANALPQLNRGEDRFKMRGAVGAGVDHCHIGLAQQIGIGAAIGHRRGVGRHNTAQPGLQGFGKANLGVEVVGRQHGFTFRWDRGLAKV